MSRTLARRTPVVSVLVAASLVTAGGAVGAVAATAPEPGQRLFFERLEGSGGAFVSPDGDLRDVSMTAEDVVLDASEVTMGAVVLEGVVPFAAVAQDVGPRTRLEPADDGRVRMIRTVQVLGRDIEVSGTGEVEAVDGKVVVEPSTVDVGGPRWFERALARGGAPLLSTEQQIEGLPPGLSLQEVDVVQGGFAVRLSGEDVVFAS